MMQLYCPACENVVWVEGIEPDDVAPCPACGHAIHWLSRRKARPVNASDPRVVAASPRRLANAPAAHASLVDAAPETGASLEDDAAWKGEAEQEFLIPIPEPLPLFVGLPYRPEGGISLGRLPVFVASVWLAGIGLGMLASFLGQICYLMLIYPLALGLALAGITVLAGHLARVRSAQLAGTIALVGGMIAVASMHLLDYRRTIELVTTEPFVLPEAMAVRLREAPSFLEYLDATAELGLTISGRDAGGLNLGYWGTYCYWGMELTLVLMIAAVGGASGARDPFCALCRVWKEDCFLGTLHDAEEMRSHLKRGRLSALECFRPSEFTGGELVLTVSVCPRCGPVCPVDVRLERNPRARQEPHPHELPLKLTLPGQALPVLEQVFQPRRARSA